MVFLSENKGRFFENLKKTNGVRKVKEFGFFAPIWFTSHLLLCIVEVSFSAASMHSSCDFTGLS